ncbi:MAG TPA: acyl-CoA ligase (AMP-forming), exosortase A system-associated, partial [Zeimonas sp.]|nr:acyl-CoA ligase (AMP-forming), exosortase A system-associated [Zeimonas sp.]
SPTEVEEAVYATGLVAEAAAFGVDHPALGQAIVLVAVPAEGRTADPDSLLALCRDRLPAYMVPQRIDWVEGALPRNANGKIDRKRLAAEREGLFR